MKKRKKKERVVVFVDFLNLYLSAKNAHGGVIDMKGFLDLFRHREIVDVYVYTATVGTIEERRFLKELETLGFTIKVKRVSSTHGVKRGNWDVGMTVDAMHPKWLQQADRIVIASGDGDFIHLVDHFKNETKLKVDVVAFEESASYRLRRAAHDFINLSKLKNIVCVPALSM
jgi:uncharacterized LabA/DUF88 family protein